MIDISRLNRLADFRKQTHLVLTVFSWLLLISTSLAQGLVQQTGANNPFNNTIGSGSGGAVRPTLVDIDGDGDLDVLGVDAASTIRFYRNTGTKTAPVYTADTSPIGLPSESAGDLSYRFGDLDGDGDLDAVTGNSDGIIIAFRNTGSRTNPSFTQLSGSSNPFAGLDFGDNSAVSLADFDGDGDLDLLSIGTQVHYLRNTGTPTAPAYTDVVGAGNPFTGVVQSSNFSFPAVADVDGDGDLDLVVSNTFGSIDYYQNSGTPTNPVFVRLSGGANPFPNYSQSLVYVATDLGDVDGDGDPDAIVGFAGRNTQPLLYLKNVLRLPQQPTPASQTVCAGGTVTTSVRASSDGAVTYQWYRNGQNTSTPVAGQTSATLTLSNVQAGDAGSYYALASGGGGTLFSTAFTLTVTGAAITGQPASGSSVCAGASVSVSTFVSTSGTVSGYQWYRNGRVVSGQTSATLTLTNVQPVQAGSYVVVVSGCNSFTSTPFSLSVTPQSPDYQPLVDLYNATNGPGWTNKTNWLTGCTPCGWYGVTCDGNGRVSDIILASNKLSGSLPASFSALTNLKFLNLTDNQLSGILPASLSALTSLQYIYLGQNQFSGSIPASLSALTNLLSLNLYSNQLSGNIPASLSALTNLKSINLLGNQLNGSIPASLSALTNLGSLILNDNQLSGSIPAGLSALTNLQSLYLQNNQLSGCFPASLSALCGKTVLATGNPGLPGGGDFDAFCRTGAGSDAFRPLATASPNPVCANSPLSLSVTAGTAYGWSGPAGFSSTAQNPTLTATTSGLYSVTVGNGSPSCSATARVNVTVNPLPSAPSLVTQSGQPYPAGVSSLTISQNVGPVSLTALGCSGGMITASGNAASSFTISTAMTGTQTYTATCTQNGCTGPAGSFQLTVLPTTLSVLHRDADYGNLTNNIIKPYLELANAGAGGVPYSEVTVRYWFTSEGNAPPTNLAVYYAQLGAVNMNYVALSQPRQGAYGYVEYSFPGGGSLAGGGNSGPIENGIQKTDGSNFDESDDYSYQANYQDYLLNMHITAYRNGTIFYGQEPTAVTSQTAVAVYSAAKDGTTTSQIQTRLELRNQGNVALPLANLKLRYYFTSDNGQLATVNVDYADIGASNVQASVVKLGTPVGGADSYVELSFPGNTMQVNALSSLGAIDFRLVRSDYGLFDQSNDYSYAANYGNVGLNNHVTAYFNNKLLFGTPPAAGLRAISQEPTAILQVRALGNPVIGSSAQVEITGVAGQAVSLRLLDLQGRSVHEQRIEQVGETESVSVPLVQSRGTLLLKVSTGSQQQSLKLLRP